MKQFFIFLFCLNAATSLHAQSDSLLADKFKIYDVRLGQEVKIDDLAIAMDQFDVIFIGEEHNDSVCHYFQKQMLKALFNKYQKNTALAMEMFDRDVQDVMDEYLLGVVKEKVFQKDARVWNNYSNYRPMVEFAKEKGLSVICANAPRRYTSLVGKDGMMALMKLPEASKKNFAPLPYDTAKGGYYNKLMGLTNHDGKTNDTAKPAAIPMGMGNFNLILSQSLWDATMAYSIASFLKANPSKKVMMVNGRFHSEESFGIVSQLSKYAPKSNALVVTVFAEENYPNIQWKQYKNLGDYIVVTDPSVPKTYEP